MAVMHILCCIKCKQQLLIEKESIPHSKGPLQMIQLPPDVLTWSQIPSKKNVKTPKSNLHIYSILQATDITERIPLNLPESFVENLYTVSDTLLSNY